MKIEGRRGHGRRAQAGRRDARRRPVDDRPLRRQGRPNLQEDAGVRRGDLRRRGAGPPDGLRRAQAHPREGRRPLGAEGPQGPVGPAGRQGRGRRARGQERDRGRRRREREQAAPARRRQEGRRPRSQPDVEGRARRGHPEGEQPGDAPRPGRTRRSDGYLRRGRGRVHPRPALHHDPDHRATGGTATRSSPVRYRLVVSPGLPVGEPRDHRAPAARPRGRALDGHLRPDARRAELDLRPRPGRPRPGARHRAAAGGLLRPLPRLRQRASPCRRSSTSDRPGRHQRLRPAHPRPVHRVARAPPAGRARPVPRARCATRSTRSMEAVFRRRQQRRLPVRLRRLAGGVRRGLRAAVRAARLARPSG